MFDLNVPFFVPLWRRVLTVALVLGWTAVEISTGAVFWAVLFGAAGVYCLWALLLQFDVDAALAKRPGDAP